MCPIMPFVRKRSTAVRAARWRTMVVLLGALLFVLALAIGALNQDLRDVFASH